MFDESQPISPKIFFEADTITKVLVKAGFSSESDVTNVDRDAVNDPPISVTLRPQRNRQPVKLYEILVIPRILKCMRTMRRSTFQRSN